MKDWPENPVKWPAPIYDAYLKSPGVKHGMRDYSRALQLIIQAERLGKWPEVGARE